MIDTTYRINLDYKRIFDQAFDNIFTREEIEYLDILGAIQSSVINRYQIKVIGEKGLSIISLTKKGGGFYVRGKKYKKIYNAIRHIFKTYGEIKC